MARKVIYLDQNIWICLAQAYYGKNRNPDDVKVCKAVLKASESDKVIFPLSKVHMDEMRHRQDPESRKRLFKFMIKVSKGHTIQPYTCLIDAELYQAIIKRIDPDYLAVNLKDFIIKKGISNMLGAKPKITSKSLNEKQIEEISNSIIGWMDGIDGFMYFYGNDKLCGGKGNTNIDYDEFLEEVEKIRDLYKNRIKDKKLRYKAVLVEDISARIIPRIARIEYDLGLPKDPMHMEKWKQDDFTNFIKDVPTFYVSFDLTYRLYRDYNKLIKKNDLYDIAFLAVAIPYCDIVVAEKTFSAIAKEAKLDKIYNTIIISSVKELGEYI